MLRAFAYGTTVKSLAWRERKVIPSCFQSKEGSGLPLTFEKSISLLFISGQHPVPMSRLTKNLFEELIFVQLFLPQPVSLDAFHLNFFGFAQSKYFYAFNVI
jgi:hypothetical protein